MSLGWTPSAGGNGAPAGRATVAQVGMELRLLSRRGENLFVTLVVPLVLLVFFSIVPATDRGGVAFLLPGILALAIVSTSLVNLGISTAFERSYGVLKRLGGSPLPRTGLIAAKIATVVVVEIGQAILLVGVAALGLGWSPGPDANVLVCLAAFGLGTLAFAGLGLFLAGSLRAEATLAIANGLFLAMILLGGVVLPVDHLPGHPRRPRPGPPGVGPVRRVPDRSRGEHRRSARSPGRARGVGRGADRPRRPHLPLGVDRADPSAGRCGRRPVAISPRGAPRRAASRPRAGSPRRAAP